MSAPEARRGLLATCVASRAAVLTNPENRKVVWWLQRASWQAGGIQAVVDEMIRRYPDRFVTRGMERAGHQEGRIYNAEEVREIRGESRELCGFRLRGEVVEDWSDMGILIEPFKEYRNRRASELRVARRLPSSYSAAAFKEACQDAARCELATYLFETFCLNPAIKPEKAGPWYLPRLVETLMQLREAQATEALAAAPVTEIGQAVHEALEYSRAERCMVVIDGLARTGKTFSVQQWCDAHSGEARYVQVPSSSDEISFYRAICEALGMGSSRAYKANDLRAKIESVLQGGDLLLCLDEGHYLWPQRNVRNAIPHRINWVLTQLVNMGVPVAIVTTPQFTKSQETIVRQGGWSSEQLIGRIDLYKKLADSLSGADLEAVARHWLAGGDEKAIRVLVRYAQTSEKYLQGIASLARRARFLAQKAGRATPTFHDVAAALQEGVVPSDESLAASLSMARGTGARRHSGKPPAEPLRPRCIAPAQPVQEPAKRADRPSVSAIEAPQRDSGESLLTG